MITFDVSSLIKDINNSVQYATGFLDGVKDGEKALLEAIGTASIESLKNYIDSSARVNPQALHHVYEWQKTGSPEARLYDLKYDVVGNGISFGYQFRQSSSVKQGSTKAFYDKARIMENGIPVTIKPVNAKVLAFTDNGEQVFTPNAVKVANPGGPEVTGAFQRTFDEFFNSYFRQSFLNASGILGYLAKPYDFSKNFARGVAGGRSVGKSVGYNWVSKAGGAL